MAGRTQAELIATLERLDKEATPGPWFHYHEKLRPQFGTIINEVQDDHGKSVVAWGGFDAADTSKRQKARDAKLIAYLRTHLPAILAALRSGQEAEERLAKMQAVERAVIRADGEGRCAVCHDPLDPTERRLWHVASGEQAHMGCERQFTDRHTARQQEGGR